MNRFISAVRHIMQSDSHFVNDTVPSKLFESAPIDPESTQLYAESEISVTQSPTRTRHATLQDFKSATTGVASKAMRNEINNMIQGVENAQQRKASIVLLSGSFYF